MADMYGRGLATGAWIGSMAGRSGSNAIELAEERSRIGAERQAAQKMAEKSLGVEIINGEVQFSPSSIPIYSKYPEFKALAIEKYQENLLENHTKAVESADKTVSLLMKIHTMNDLDRKRIEKDFSLTPEQRFEALREVDNISYNAAMQYIPDIMRRPVTQSFIQRNKNLNNSELQEGIFEANLKDYNAKLSDPNFELKLSDLTNISTAFNGLSDEAKLRFKPTVDKLMATKPFELERIESERKIREAKRMQDVQTSGAVARQKALEPLRIEEEKKKAENRAKITAKYDDKMALILRSMGKDPEKIRKGEVVLTPQEAEAALEKLAKTSGIAEIIKLLGAGGAAGGKVIDYDSSGNVKDE